MGFIRRHPLLVGALSLAIIVTLFFGVRFVMHAVYWEAHTREPVAGWMTVGYVGKSWNINPRKIDELAGLPQPDGHPMTLNEIAEERGVPVADIIAEVEAAVAELGQRKK